MPDKKTEFVTFCIIKAPRVHEGSNGIPARLSRVITFSEQPRASLGHRLPAISLALDKVNAYDIWAEVLSFRGRYVPQPDECTHVAELRLHWRDDYLTLMKDPGWTKHLA